MVFSKPASDAKIKKGNNENWVGTFWLTKIIIFPVILIALVMPICSVGTINVFRNNMGIQSRKTYSSVWTTAEPFGEFLAVFIVSYLLVWRPMPSLFTTIGLIIFITGIFFSFKLKDDLILDEKWEGSVTSKDATVISSERLPPSSAAVSRLFTGTFTRQLLVDETQLSSANADSAFCVRNIFDQLIAFNSPGLLAYSFAYLFISIPSFIISEQLPIIIALHLKISGWKAGYLILPYEFGKIIGCFILTPALSRLMSNSTGTFDGIFGSILSIVFSLPVFLIMTKVTIINDIKLLTVILTTIGFSIGASANKYMATQIVSEFTRLYERSDMPAGKIPPFRSAESLLIAFGYLGKFLGTVGVISGIFIKGSVTAAWEWFVIVMMASCICCIFCLIIARRKFNNIGKLVNDGLKF